eukprot:SAG31_NODE_6304_length_2074_cov_1.476962_1_plen_485_part_10
MEAYHQEARRRGISYEVGTGAEGDRHCDGETTGAGGRARTPESQEDGSAVPIQENVAYSWDNVPIGAASRAYRPSGHAGHQALQPACSDGNKAGATGRQSVRRGPKSNTGPFGRQWNDGFANGGPAWDMLPENVLDDEPPDNSPLRRNRKPRTAQQRKTSASTARAAGRGPRADVQEHEVSGRAEQAKASPAEQVKARKARQRAEEQARHVQQLAAARRQVAAERRLAAARSHDPGLNENQGIRPFAALRAQLREEGPDAGIIAFGNAATGGSAQRPFSEPLSNQRSGRDNLAMADPSQMSWADFQRMMATEHNQKGSGVVTTPADETIKLTRNPFQLTRNPFDEHGPQDFTESNKRVLSNAEVPEKVGSGLESGENDDDDSHLPVHPYMLASTEEESSGPYSDSEVPTSTRRSMPSLDAAAGSRDRPKGTPPRNSQKGRTSGSSAPTKSSVNAHSSSATPVRTPGQRPPRKSGGSTKLGKAAAA